MPYARSTLPQLIQQVQTNVASRLVGSNPWLSFSTLQVLSYVFGGLQYEQYSYLDYISQQAIPVTSTGSSLEAWAALKGVTRIAAAYSSGSITFSGNIGAVVSDGTQVIRDDGVLYQVPIGGGGVIGGGGTFETTAIAVIAGINGNMASGGTMALVVPSTGVQSTVAITTNFVGGTDLETDDSLRTRMIEVFSNPPEGGDLQDYVTWSLQVPLISRAWSAGPTLMGAGSLSVFFMADLTESAFAGIPQGTNGGSVYETRNVTATGDQLILANYLYPLRSAGAIVWAMAPVSVPLNLTLSGVPVDTTIRAGITAALAAVLIRTASPNGVLLPDLSAGGTVFLSDLWDAVAAVPGLANFDIVAPTTNIVQSLVGRISTPGTITYI